MGQWELDVGTLEEVLAALGVMVATYFGCECRGEVQRSSFVGVEFKRGTNVSVLMIPSNGSLVDWGWCLEPFECRCTPLWCW